MNSRVSSTTKWVIAIASVGLLGVACDRRDERAVERATERVATGAERLGERVVNGAERVGERVANGAEGVGDRAENGAERAGERAAEAARPSGTTLAFGDAIGNIAESRCEREARCGNVGAGKRWASSQACRAAVREDFSDDLNPQECRAGIDRTELSECMEEIRNENCNNPVDTLERVAACRTTDLCRNVPPARSVSMR